MRIARRRPIPLVLVLVILSIAAGPCSSKNQPRTVADILTTAGNVKRQLRERDRQVPGTGISAQADYDISAKLVKANLAYKSFIEDEQARLAADPNAQPNPDARKQILTTLIAALKDLQDPSILGIRSANAQKVWHEAIAGMNTLIEGMKALQGGD